MKNIVFVFFSSFLLVACHDGIQKPDAPDDLIEERKMTEIMKDLMLIEGHISVTYKQMNKYFKIMDSSSARVFKEHKVTEDQFTRSFEFYATDQEKITRIYSKILDELTLLKGQLEE
ncbi:MAG: DUF4296 domain-containing protein [Crocinitomicaceae bacterium]|jgi:hypothetical protein|nr:DUF4296 domain-containing protein [Crocinitomicaceae bacterium]